ncbi:hypothetical protein [uncultured Deefgea sp.]|uniref:hypothetical protein n=1 Tax=uncultured Deefgea sp. TaxID=1304914 RepID=UPI002595C2B7|nr:hypothetical protein [uncultured Deefgea sp.]
MSFSGGVDLNVALTKIHELAQQDGDLGCEYWNSIYKLLIKAASMQDTINHLSHELEICRAQHYGE